MGAAALRGAPARSRRASRCWRRSPRTAARCRNSTAPRACGCSRPRGGCRGRSGPSSGSWRRRSAAVIGRRRGRRDEALLDATGIRTGRRAPVFVTPPALASLIASPSLPAAPEPEPEPGGPEVGKVRKCYVCKAEYRRLHAFYDQLCPPCADFNYEKRAQTADLHGPRRARHRRPREDRLPGGDPAAPRRGAGHRHHPVPPRRRPPLRRRGRLPRVGGPPRDPRARPPAHPRGRALRPRARRARGEARLHPPQRLPDGAPPARLLRPPRRPGAGAARRAPRPGAPAAPRVPRGAPGPPRRPRGRPGAALADPRHARGPGAGREGRPLPPRRAGRRPAADRPPAPE